MAKGGNGGNGNGGGDGGTTGPIKGNKRDNILTGTAGDDIIQGLAGNDTITGLAGDDTIDGGSGSDTAIFSGLRTDYTVVQIDATTVEITGPDGTDTVTNIEYFQFSDQTESFADVIINPQANLSAGLLSVTDTDLDPGESLTANWTINSDGELDAGATQATLVIASAPDLASVVSTGETVDTSAISTGGTLSLSADLLGDTLAPGTYYLAVVIDDADTLDESDETDNVTNWVAFTVAEPEQNLTAVDLSLTDTDLQPGESLTASWTINAQGNTGIGATNTNLIIATAPDMGSVISTVGPSGVGALDPGQSTNQSLTVAYDSLAPGTYYMAAVADAGDAIDETDETDNVTNWVAFTVAEPVYNIALTEFVLSDTLSDVDLKDDARLIATYTVENTGNIGTASYTVTSVLSLDGMISPDDLVIGTYGGTLALGETKQFSDALVIDGSAVLAGDYQVLSYVSWDGGPIEADLTDNTAAPQSVTLVGGLIAGTSGDDIFVGTAASEVFDLGDGDDIVFGSSGDDDILGGAGFDIVDFSNLDEAMIFGENWDTVETGDFEVLPYASAMAGTADWRGTFSGVEKVIGTDYDDVFYFWEDVAIEIDAGLGNDAVHGSTSDDLIFAGAGDDIIAGYFGNDQITTGTGSDLVYVERADYAVGPSEGHGHDIVTDFDPLLDVLMVGYYPNNGVYDPLSDLTQAVNGALLSYADDSSILLAGVDISQLDATNVLVDELGLIGY